MKIKILGISGSPVKNGNVDNFLDYIVNSISRDDVITDTIHLSAYTIKDCIHCN